MSTLSNRRTIATPQPRVRTVRKGRKWTRYSPWTFYLFISPWVLGFIALTALPLLYALLLSFTNFDGLSGHWHWVGLRNYQEAFHDPIVWSSLTRSVLYAVITVPLSITVGLGLAVLLNQRIRAVGIYRTLFYLPSVIPIVATALMFKLLFDRDTGVVNAVIERFGGTGVAWLTDPHAFFVLILLSLWGLGGGMIIFLAGLQGIPAELLESAQVDGANGVQRFFWITLPLLTPVLLFQLVVSLIISLQTLVQPLLLSPAVNSGAGGGFTDPTHVQQGNYLYMINVYAQFFDYQRYGYGSALLWILFALILVGTLLVLRSSSFWVYYETEQS